MHENILAVAMNRGKKPFKGSASCIYKFPLENMWSVLVYGL